MEVIEIQESKDRIIKGICFALQLIKKKKAQDRKFVHFLWIGLFRAKFDSMFVLKPNSVQIFSTV